MITQLNTTTPYSNMTGTRFERTQIPPQYLVPFATYLETDTGKTYIWTGQYWSVQFNATPYILDRSGVAVTAPADTTEDILTTVIIPGNAMGPNAVLEIMSLWTFNNNANAKTARIRLGGIGGTAYENVNGANNVSAATYTPIWNRASQQSQIGAQPIGFGLSTSANITSTLDMTQDQTVVFTSQKATGSDTITLEAYLVRIFATKVP